MDKMLTTLEAGLPLLGLELQKAGFPLEQIPITIEQAAASVGALLRKENV